MTAIDQSEAQPRAVPVRVVLLSALGVWLFYFVLVTARGAVTDPARVLVFLAPRGVVSLAGVGVTLLLWLVLRQLERRSLGVRIAAVMLLGLPAAVSVAWVNIQAFRDIDSNSLIADGATRVLIEKDRISVSTPGTPTRVFRLPEKRHSVWRELSDIALSRYFLIIAWGALYLALANAEAVRAGERREAALRRTAKAAELRSLRYQVNPHFLFNTLNSLSALVMTGREHDAEAMIQTLSSFYRATLAGDPTVDVALGEEVALQRLYLDIEAIRFPQRLQVVFDIPDELADICVPGLILQPLVENAVKYGVAESTRAVTVTIRAAMAGARLAVTVEDDGAGAASGADGCGIGLRNVRDRLIARYGEGATDFAVDRRGTGYAVTLTLPVHRDGC